MDTSFTRFVGNLPDSIDQFNLDFADAFERCDCDDFKADYYRSIKYYTIACCIITFLAITNLFGNCVMCCMARRIKPL